MAQNPGDTPAWYMQGQTHQKTPGTNQGQPGLPSVLQHLEQQTHNRQALGALAAASITSSLGGLQTRNNHQDPQNYNYYPDYQRPVIAYDDLPQPDIAPKPFGVACCNRTYKSDTALEQHQKQHIQCPNSGCDFVGIKVVLEDHEETMHGKPKKNPNRSDGVVPPNAPRLDTPEALAAWIAARKKNWPSEANIERKAREAKERAAKGQLPKKNGKRKGKELDKPKVKKERVTKEVVAETKPIITSSLGLISGYGSDSEEEMFDAVQTVEEIMQIEPSEKAKNEPQNTEQSTDSEDDSDDSDDLVDPTKDAISSKDPSSSGKIPTPEAPRSFKRICKYFSRGQCRRGDGCHFSHEIKPKKRPEPRQPVKVEAVHKRPNLLRMLLDKDIRQERNMILQSLRFITDNDFLGEANSKR
ncbi:hypothetical protein CLU79DRAFT_836536 [Phycomyces nitens]|nr:hypothetical protein CLU79DRAFT_836536 [Phycomyces nitens]